MANVDHLVDINDLHGELGSIVVEDDRVRIGALTRHRELLESARLTAAFPIFDDAERVIADPVVRNRGTIGGSLCQADPAEDLSAVCTALGATCILRGLDGERELTMEEFHRGPYETACGPAEMLVEVRIPLRPHGSSAYAKVERRAGDWAVAAAATAVWLDGPAGPGNAVIADVRIGLAAVGPYPLGLPEVTEALRGQPPGDELYARAGAIAARSCRPLADQRGSVEYKRHLADELTRRTLRRAVERVTGGS
jgi:carbon-monoxide dehydrogenase medium subunit